jgi:hypothetical protein
MSPGRRNFNLIDSPQSAAVDTTQARKTALIVAGALSLLAVWNLYRHRSAPAIVLGAIGGALLLTGVFLPGVARRFQAFWMQVSAVLGYINTRIILGVLFYGMFTPYTIVMRLAGRDILNRRSSARETYWVPRKNTRQSKDQFERWF